LLTTLKLRGIIALANMLGWTSRITKRGSGVMVTGRTILKLSPHAVSILSRHRKIVLVSGTNGKTTTTFLIYHALATQTNVVSNFTGANLFAGLATALSKDLNAPTAALEVDEMVLPWAITETQPELVVLLNLGRDQLDRLSEVRVVAQKWRNAIKTLPPDCTVLADADDPFVTWAARDWPAVIWFSSGAKGHLDASTCPECGAILHWTDEGGDYSCRCGFQKPIPDWILRSGILSGPNNQTVTVHSAIPGAAAESNAARAIVAAARFGILLHESADAVSRVSSVDGRFGLLRIGRTNFRLLLSKNPASWRETLQTSGSGPICVALVVNANTQDGRDTSWLWDVDFTPLRGRKVVVTGERRLDVSARLTVNEIPHDVVENEVAAAEVFGAVPADLIASYTAFHRLAKSVTRP
jgi:UDP-N-acetylmuramyl tripeptide synthase